MQYWRMTLTSISFPEPTCLLVSTKTRSSGIINFQRPTFQDFRLHGACVASFIWGLEIKSMWIRSTKAFNKHWKNQESRNLALKAQQYQILGCPVLNQMQAWRTERNVRTVNAQGALSLMRCKPGELNNGRPLAGFPLQHTFRTRHTYVYLLFLSATAHSLPFCMANRTKHTDR